MTCSSLALGQRVERRHEPMKAQLAEPGIEAGRSLPHTRCASGRHLSYAVHFNPEKSTIPCNRVRPALPLSWYLLGLLEMICPPVLPRLSRSKPVNVDNRLHESPPRVCFSADAANATCDSARTCSPLRCSDRRRGRERQTSSAI